MAPPTPVILALESIRNSSILRMTCGGGRRPRPGRSAAEAASGILSCCPGAESRPEGARREGRDPPEIPGSRGAVRLREHVQDPLDQARAAPGNLFGLPPVLHRAPEAHR